MSDLQAIGKNCETNVSLTSTQSNSYMRQQCSMGYYGPVCSLCVKDEFIHYGRTGNLACKPCKDKAAIVAAYVGSTILILLFLTFVTQITLQENEDSAAGLQNVGRTSEFLKVSIAPCCKHDTFSLANF